MINNTTYQQPVKHQAVQNHSKRGSQHGSNNFRPQNNQNNQLQQLLNLLLPLLQQLISNLGNNDGNNQHYNNQCDSKPPQELQLSDTEKERLFDAIFPPGTNFINAPVPSSFMVKDLDNDSQISVGDEVTYEVGGSAAPGSTQTVIMTQENIDRFNTANPSQELQLDLPLRQEDAIRQRFDDNSALAFDGLATQFTGRSFDDNDDGQLSAGDSIEIRRFGGNAIPQTDFVELQTLTADDITAFNTFANQPILNIDNAQRVRLQDATIGQFFGFGNGSFLNSVIDSNGDNQISVGDTLKIVTVDGAETLNATATSSFQELTQEQFDRFEAGIVFDRLGQQVDGTGK